MVLVADGGGDAEGSGIEFAVGDSATRPTGVDVDGSLERELAHLHGRFVLVRPDHFIAATWVPADTRRVEQFLSAFLIHP